MGFSQTLVENSFENHLNHPPGKYALKMGFHTARVFSRSSITCHTKYKVQL